MGTEWPWKATNEHYKSGTELINTLIETRAKGGNLLLNVVPNGRGEFEPRAQSTLAAIGEWTRLHGRSIYGCTASDFTPPPDCRFTQNGRRLYLHDIPTLLRLRDLFARRGDLRLRPRAVHRRARA